VSADADYMLGLTIDAPLAAGGTEPSTPLLRHPVRVAVLCAALVTLVFATYPLGAGAAITAFMAVVLVVVAATDIERRIIPNRVVLPATAIILFARIAFTPGRALECVLAATAAAAVFLATNLTSGNLMGMGDVKLALMLGAGLGWGVIGAVCLAFLGTFPFGLAVLARGGLAARSATLPFGPFLAFGALLIMLVPRLAGFGGS
jgi:leader peptidase (prepilin peptidase) / N-methyltransferase